MRPFHIALAVSDLSKARQFYGDILGCEEGRSDETWVDFNFFGHQLVFHLNPDHKVERFLNPVDSHPVPIPHFGVILEWADWEALAATLRHHDVPFVVEPYVRFKGKPGEQGTMFFYDPNGLSLEFKAFKNDSMIFEK